MHADSHLSRPSAAAFKILAKDIFYHLSHPDSLGAYFADNCNQHPVSAELVQQMILPAGWLEAIGADEFSRELRSAETYSVCVARDTTTSMRVITCAPLILLPRIRPWRTLCQLLIAVR